MSQKTIMGVPVIYCAAVEDYEFVILTEDRECGEMLSQTFIASESTSEKIHAIKSHITENTKLILVNWELTEGYEEENPVIALAEQMSPGDSPLAIQMRNIMIEFGNQLLKDMGVK